MIAKKIESLLANALKKFQKSRHEEVSALLKTLHSVRSELDKASLSELLKFQSLFFGSIVGSFHTALVVSERRFTDWAIRKAVSKIM
jgi:phage terminase large subunit-like protein